MNRRKNLDMVVGVCVFLAALAGPAGAVTHYVGPGESIQAAIDDPCTVNGDDIEVAPGTYNEAINFNGKAVRLYSSSGPEVTTIDGGRSMLLLENFDDGDYDGWDPCSQGNTDCPGLWSAVTGEMVQSTNCHTVPASDPNMLGTFAWWQSGLWWTDYEVTLNLRSSDDDGIGVMFRYQDPNNYYRFTWLRQNHSQGVGRRRLVKCRDGQFTVLDVDDVVFTQDQDYTVRIVAQGFDLQVFIDGAPVLSATDVYFIRGSIALYCWGNPGAYFDDVSVVGKASHVVQCVSGEDSNTILEGFTITGGKAPTAFGVGGGGMYNKSSSPTVTNCNFTGNLAYSGGGMCNYLQSSPTVTNCTFSGNTSRKGGGMFNQSSSSPTVTNCTFSGNLAQHRGGGMYNSSSSPTVTNCTFIGNSATSDGGGMYNFSNCSPTVTNCILWGDEPNEISYDATSTTTVSYSDVEGGTSESWFGTGCIDADPCFLDADANDFRLLYYSQCVDAGDNNSVPADVTTDLDGNPRVVDGDGDGNSVVDMGAFEAQLRVHNITQDTWYMVIQAAIDDADPNDEIKVLAGTYNEAINFIGKAIRLYSTDGQDVTTIDGTGHYHVVQCVNNEDANTILEGFTITGGNANGGSHPDWHGGGMYCENSSPTVKNCAFSGNSAIYDGGGMFNWDNSSPTVTDCTFSSNSAQRYGGGMANYSSSPTVTNCTLSGNSAVDYGGGMYDSNSSPTVTDCNFSGNTAGWDGGGMYNYDSSSPTVTNCNFSGNSAVGNDGGAINNVWYSSPTITNCTFSDNSAYDWGGAMRNLSFSSPTLTNCIFAGNSSDEGGGMFNWDNSSPTVTNCTFSGNIADANGGGMCNYSYSNPKVTDCTFSGNSAVESGGGMCNAVSSPTVTNCTFSGNSAFFGGGMENYYYSSPTVANCTFSGNSALWDGGGMDNYESSSPTVTNCILWGDEPDEIYDDFTCSTTVNYSDVEDGWWGAGGNNIDADPYFVDAGGGNLRLGLGSPCIDAGDNSAVPSGVTTDLNGFARFIDDLCTGDSGNGTPPIVDMGAYEHLPADIDGSGAVDLRDFCEFALHWGETGCGRCGGANMTCGGDVDWNDLRELTDWWLAGK